MKKKNKKEKKNKHSKKTCLACYGLPVEEN